MKIENYQFPKSSFLSMEKDLSLIIDKICANKRLNKLLYYNTPDCLSKKDLDEEQIMSLFGKNVKLVPKLSVDGEVFNYIIVTFDNFTPNNTNPEFRDNIIEFDIICHFDQWQLKNQQLRPYKIAAEIDSMINNKHLTGIGELQFLGANQMILTDEFGGLCLMYAAIHGEEDKKNAPVPSDNEQIIRDFNELYND